LQKRKDGYPVDNDGRGEGGIKMEGKEGWEGIYTNWIQEKKRSKGVFQSQ